MTVPAIFESCRPRPDVLAGTVAEADFAADLAQVIVGKGTPDYLDPKRFFANTYPTRGLKNLLANVCGRLSGAGGEAASIFRLDTSYGGGQVARLDRAVPRRAQRRRRAGDRGVRRSRAAAEGFWPRSHRCLRW